MRAEAVLQKFYKPALEHGEPIWQARQQRCRQLAQNYPPPAQQAIRAVRSIGIAKPATKGTEWIMLSVVSILTWGRFFCTLCSRCNSVCRCDAVAALAPDLSSLIRRSLVRGGLWRACSEKASPRGGGGADCAGGGARQVHRREHVCSVCVATIPGLSKEAVERHCLHFL